MSVIRNVPWVRVDGRTYVDAMAVEALLRDWATELDAEDDADAGNVLRKVAQSLGEMAVGRAGEIHV